MSWSDFIDRVFLGTIKADLIWGGVDLSGALDMVPGLKDPSTRERFLHSLNKINATFGTVNELLRAAGKFDLIGDLDYIAKYKMGTPRPETRLLSLDGRDDNIDIRSWIFRREGSHNFDHVEACVTPSELPAHPKYRWMKQQHVRSLDRHVEWHVFMIKGKVKCVFYVMPMDEVGLREVHGVERDEYSYRSVWLRTKGWDLATMNTFARRSNGQLVHRSGGTRASLEQADAEMRKFAEGTLAELIRLEKRWFKGQLSIETFCRMDLGIMQDESGQLRYFVHGIRRGSFIEMFPSEVEDGIFQYLSNEILKALRG
ncbi:uncharacterized protein BT62DRAFT_740080 [Guyanagaster necrorhizus]|uniref:Uncharacterized protein n=1 Tax=Guyanagaster necrorhizus TaxID=856835 RepID=A0A9P7VEP4_9AGAR|nr:uncharacterized protein BT62DRAFT_740080 [Guyanagaster necrorhizus MCA 3950]KAG7439329.1 hypothetical protein BT62DRAFT_740080 [Guyanagaster necrorhizus MCA 3950]